MLDDHPINGVLVQLILAVDEYTRESNTSCFCFYWAFIGEYDKGPPNLDFVFFGFFHGNSQSLDSWIFFGS